jgi:hypothetical protein
MSLLTRVKNTGGITSRSIRDAGVVGFKLDKEILSGVVFEEIFDHLPDPHNPFSFPTNSIDGDFGHLLRWRNHAFHIIGVPQSAARVWDPQMTNGFRMPIGGPAEGYQIAWTEGMSINLAGDMYYLQSGRYSTLIGGALQRGALLKVRLSYASYAGVEANELVVGMRRLLPDPTVAYLDASGNYTDFCAVRIDNPLGSGEVVQKYTNLNGAGAVINQDDNLTAPADDTTFELAVLLVDGVCAVFLDGVEVAGPQFTFDSGDTVLPYLFWLGNAGEESVTLKDCAYYRAHHANTEIQESEKDVIEEPQVEALLFDASGP